MNRVCFDISSDHLAASFRNAVAGAPSGGGDLDYMPLAAQAAQSQHAWAPASWSWGPSPQLRPAQLPYRSTLSVRKGCGFPASPSFSFPALSLSANSCFSACTPCAGQLRLRLGTKPALCRAWGRRGLNSNEECLSSASGFNL